MADTPQATLNVLIVGACPEYPNDLDSTRRVGREIGQALGASPHRVLVCSSHESSLDRYVIEGVSTVAGNVRGKVWIFRPADRRKNPPGGSLKDQWDDFLRKNPLSLYKEDRRVIEGPSLDVDGGFSNAFLLCQLEAQSECDVILAAGGKDTATASTFFRFVHGRKPIMPYPILGGAAEQLFERDREHLRMALGERYGELLEGTGVNSCVSDLDQLVRGGRVWGSRVFLSYSWQRKAEADRVEAILRRVPGLDFFRDEVDIRRGDNIGDEIRDELAQCTVFLALWSKEYAVSPHCFDEFEQVSNRKPPPRIVLLRLDDTRPVWPALRGRPPNQWAGNWPTVFDYDNIELEIVKLFGISGSSESKE